MGSRKKKRSPDKHEHPITKAEEPQLALRRQGTALSWAHGSPQDKNYVRRSMKLLGIASESPFNKVVDAADFIWCVREGIPKKALDHLIAVTGINAGDMASIIRTSGRTLRRYSGDQKLNPEQSERIIELAKLYSRGEEVFDSMESFKEWMNSTVVALGNAKPRDFLDTSFGIELLMDEVGRIEHGIFA